MRQNIRQDVYTPCTQRAPHTHNKIDNQSEVAYQQEQEKELTIYIHRIPIVCF